MEYQRRGFNWSQRSPLISATKDPAIAEGFAQEHHRRTHPEFPGEVLVLEVPARHVCDRNRWQRISAASGPVSYPDHPVFQTCHVLQFPGRGETQQWVFVHEIPAKYVIRSYPFPPDPRFNCNASGGEQAGDPDNPPRSGKLRGKAAKATSTSGTSASPGGKTLKFGGVTIDLDTLYRTVLEYLKKEFQAALQAKIEEVRGEFEAAAHGHAQALYQDFLWWLNERAHAAIGSQFPIESQAFEQEFLAWLNAPGDRLRTHIEDYFTARSATIAWLIEAYQDSWTIADGLKHIWEDAKAKYDRFTRAYDDAVSTPKTPYSDTLTKHGFSGPWIDRFKSYEGQFSAFNDRYKIVRAGEIVVGAFQSVPRDKISSLFQLLELMGGVAEESRIPIVSFFGEVVKAYGEVANAMLAKINSLADQIRARQEYCLGVGTTPDARNDAYTKMFGNHTLICPTRLSPDIYEPVEPNDGRL